jgi:HD-GYP domain-containing protein (c-di-GMP phosphodiesterase class II)
MTYQGETELWRARPAEPAVFLSTLPAGRRDRWLALAVVIISTAVFAVAVPIAKRPLEPVVVFYPVYQSALVIIELITAVLLFGQYTILRGRALLVLGCAYLFSASMAVAHALSFPGLFAQSGLLGAGPQSTAWIYFLWHGAFPLLVIAYALLRGDGVHAKHLSASPWKSVACGISATVGAAAALTYLATGGHDVLPAIMTGDRDASTKVVVAVCTWLLSVAALPLLWRGRRHSVLDLWLMVVMVVWIFEVALAAVFNAGRYDIGWYAGRIYGLLAGSFVLGMLLLENGLLYARLVKSHENERAVAAFLKDQNAFLESEVQRRTAEVGVIQDVTIVAMASLAESRDNETGNHIRRTQEYVRALANELRTHPRFKAALDDKTIEILYKSAPLHDIGKVGIPDAILLKPGKLTPEEFEIIKTHTTIGRDAIAAAEKLIEGRSTFLRLAREIAHYHQEKWDGSGYPEGLRGDAIPVSARLMALADVYDALISRRVYKPPFPHEKSVFIITEGRGSHFDPDIVDAFLRIQGKFRAIAEQFTDTEEEVRAKARVLA